MPRVPSPRTALAALTGLNFLNYVDRFVPAAVMPAIIVALHLTDTQAGSLSTLFILSYSFISPVAGRLGDRRPRFQLAAIGVFIWSAATFGSGLAPTFAALVLARALTGVGEASYTVVTPSLLSDFYPPARRGRALAIFYAAIPVGSALGYVLGGAINARFGWRWAFFLAGIPGAALAAAGLVGTLIGGRLGDRLAERHPAGHFLLSGMSLVLSLPFAVIGVLVPSPAIFWPAMFVALTLLFLNTGPLNAAMANVLPPHLRGWGFAINTTAIHLFGDAASPYVIGFISDRAGLQLPVLVTAALPILAGLGLLAGRQALTADLARVAKS
jgi:MFS family permease